MANGKRIWKKIGEKGTHRSPKHSDTYYERAYSKAVQRQLGRPLTPEERREIKNRFIIIGGSGI